MKKTTKLKNFNWDIILGNDRAIAILSIIAAIIIWLNVIIIQSPGMKIEIKGIPVNLKTVEEKANAVKLDLIESDVKEVDIVVDGNRATVGTLKASDFIINTVSAQINSPGTLTLQLQAQSVTDNGTDYTVVSINPSKVTIKLDRPDSETFKLETEITNMRIEEGFLQEEASVNIYPSQVTVSGPSDEIERIARCVVRASFDEPLSSTTEITSKIVLLDKAGREIHLQYAALSETEATIQIPILRVKQVPLKISFLNMPEDFDVSTIRYTISTESINVAGPIDQIESFGEIHVGYVDFKQLDLDSVFTFDIPLKSGFVNVENITAVTVSFEIENHDSALFSIKDIDILNKPTNYNVEVLTTQLKNVKLVGPADVLETITSKDIAAVVDLGDRVISNGQFNMPVMISTPGKNGVWAVGDYLCVIKISQD